MLASTGTGAFLAGASAAVAVRVVRGSATEKVARKARNKATWDVRTGVSNSKGFRVSKERVGEEEGSARHSWRRAVVLSGNEGDNRKEKCEGLKDYRTEGRDERDCFHILLNFLPAYHRNDSKCRSSSERSGYDPQLAKRKKSGIIGPNGYNSKKGMTQLGHVLVEV
jgi:hypothetical protein